MTSNEIRQQFIDFFTKQHAHTFVPSSPTVPHDDPTLLFTNAGMNQFKPYFLGTAKSPEAWHGRVANTQKCIRAGGKHNDLDDVGRSRRHHTFFEMLGNWSFGNYFKQGAIEMAWELLTKVWKLDPTRLHVSCFEGHEAHGIPRDTEAADIWRKVANWEQFGHKSDDHIHYFGKDNFWEMGDTGPCGPCTEIYIDRTPDKSGGPQVNGEDPRVMEVWNLVFIQYNRDAQGKLTPLPAQHVDTGMGLERICQVIQNANDNYGTDLWTPLFAAIAKISGKTYTGQFPPTNAADPVLEAANEQLRIDIAFRVIADHIRCLTFALTDGAVPSNEGRGYVLRRILRRAVRFGRQQLGLHDPFLHQLVQVVVDSMGHMFPELKKNPQRVVDLVTDEEVSFGKTIDRGIEHFDFAVAKIVGEEYARRSDLLLRGVTRSVSGWAIELRETDRGTDIGSVSLDIALTKLRSGKDLCIDQHKPVIVPAADAFMLYDTFGFPIDLTRIMAEERGMKVDLEGYERLMEEAKERSRSAGKEGESPVFDLPPDVLAKLAAQHIHPTDDHAKFDHKPARATIRAIWNGTDLDQSTDNTDARPGEEVALILDKTNFYAEMGGQIGDAGEIRTDAGGSFEVETTRSVGGYVLHIGHLRHGKITVGEPATAMVQGGRDMTMKHHTATHMANWALREVLGDAVQQKGSLVDPEKLRFDFVHAKPMADDELAKVETLVTNMIAQKLPVYAETHPQEQALKIHGLRAMFGEKYPPMVRVVTIGEPASVMLQDPANPKWRAYSIEFCGGTHLHNAAEAEAFAILSDEAVSKGVRRIVAVTGPLARDAAAQSKVIDDLIAQSASTAPENLPGAIAALQKALTAPAIPLRARRRAQAAIADLQEKHKAWQKSSSLKPQASSLAFDPESLLASAQTVAGTMLIVAAVPGANADALRNTWDWLKKKHPQQNVAAFLASQIVENDKDGNPLPPKVNLLAAVSDPLVAKLKAGDWVKTIAPIVGGSGGGRPQLAMAGGKDTAKIPDALTAAKTYAEQKLA